MLREDVSPGKKPRSVVVYSTFFVFFIERIITEIIPLFIISKSELSLTYRLESVFIPLIDAKQPGWFTFVAWLRFVCINGCAYQFYLFYIKKFAFEASCLARILLKYRWTRNCIWEMHLIVTTRRAHVSRVQVARPYFFLLSIILRTILSNIAYIEGRTKRRLKMKDTTKMEFFAISWRLRHSLLIINALHTLIRSHFTHVPKNSLNVNIFTCMSETDDKLPINGLV